MSAVQAVLRTCGSVAGIGYWRFDAARGLLHWPSGFGPPAKDDSYASWWPLGEFGQYLVPADRSRFFDYFENLFEPESTKSLDFPIVDAKGARIYLRLDGAPIAGSEQMLAVGLVRDVTRRVEADDRARLTAALLEALALTVSAGILIFDGQGRFRRANRPTLKLFGVDSSEGDEQEQLRILANRIPAPVLADIAECRKTNSAATGLLPPEFAPEAPVRWRANPFGRGGIVAVFEVQGERAGNRQVRVPDPALQSAAKAAPSPAIPAAAAEPRSVTEAFAVDRTRSYLDYVHHPCLIIQTRDASIDFANRTARDKLGLKATGKIHINNLFEISGRHAPRGVYVTGDRVQHMVTLPMGARVSRMHDIDPDLLFVEYI